MANVLPRERQIEVLRLMVEGNSLRSITRLTGTHRTAVQRLLVSFGQACERFLDLSLSNLQIEHLQLDELWTFCGKKEGHLKGREKYDPSLGDQYLFLALDPETKLIASWKLGKRTSGMTHQFVNDLAGRLVHPPMLTDNSPQFSTDGWKSYVPAIRGAFKGRVKHGVLIKNYVNPESGRYAPPQMIRAERIPVRGIENARSICTSHIERCNLTVRTFMRRFTRLAMGFSKKVENLTAACAVQIAHYNFCWRPRHKKGGLRSTPAMAAGIVDTLWKMEDLYDAVMKQENDRLQRQSTNRLLDKLRQTAL